MKKPCGGGVEVAFEVQEPQAADRPEVDGESAAGAREGLPSHLSEVEQQWRKRCREVGAEYIPPTAQGPRSNVGTLVFVGVTAIMFNFYCIG